VIDPGGCLQALLPAGVGDGTAAVRVVRVGADRVGGSDVQRDGPLVGEQPGLDRAAPLLDRNLRGKVPRDSAEARANPFGTSASADERPGPRGLERAMPW
jgi:hypothetical protein